MLRTIFKLVAWACLAFITYASISPIGYRPEIDTGGYLDLLANYDRYVGFMVLGGLFYLAYPRRPILVFAIVFGSAALLEFAQLLTVDRHARVSDAVQKMVGGAIGMIFSNGAERLHRWLGMG